MAGCVPPGIRTPVSYVRPSGIERNCDDDGGRGVGAGSGRRSRFPSLAARLAGRVDPTGRSLAVELGLSTRRHGSNRRGEETSAVSHRISASGVLDMKKVFTTGQGAKICKVAPRTVSKWFDSGRLLGYRIPGSQDRRIPREHLLRFLKEHGMPLGDLEAEVYHKILVVGADAPMLTALREHLREGDDFRVETAASGFEAGIRAESFHPDCIVIDLAVGRIEAGQIAQNLRKSPDHISTILIALTSDEPGEETYSLGFNDAFKKPFDGALLAERIRRLISQKKADEP